LRRSSLRMGDRDIWIVKVTRQPARLVQVNGVIKLQVLSKQLSRTGANTMASNLLVGLITTICLAFSSAAHAQQRSQLPRIGWLSAGASSNEFPEKQALDGLRELGWIDGKNVTIDFRYAAGNSERLSQQATELVNSNVDVIVTFSAGVAVSKQATATTPIVVGTSQDPVRAGYVTSLARPGGNLTGVTFLTDDLSGKRLELLKEAIPALTRAAVLWEPTHVDTERSTRSPMQTPKPSS